jgi:hypothetical protein
MADFYEESKDFSGGVQSAPFGDSIDSNALNETWNTQFRYISEKGAQIGSRPGLTLVNSTAKTTGAGVGATIQWSKQYTFSDGNDSDYYTAHITDEGEIFYKDADDTLTSYLAKPANFPDGTKCFTANPTAFIDGAVLNDRLFLVNSAGDRTSLQDQDFRVFGLSTIGTISVSNVATGSASMPAETYNVGVTAFNLSTGDESNISASVSVTLTANQRIRVQITPSASETAQYEYWRVYLQRTTTQAQKYKVLVLENSGGTNIVTDGNIPIATTDVYIDLSAADIANLIIAEPSETENDTLPSTVKYLAAYGQRLIAADDNNIYWSKQNAGGMWPAVNTESVNSGDGDTIKGLVVVDDELLLILMNDNVFGLFGNDPQNWVLRPISQTYGCVGHYSIVPKTPMGTMWWSHSGPTVYADGKVQLFGLDKLGYDSVIDNIESTRLERIWGSYDENARRVLFAVSATGVTTRNNVYLPFNIQLGQWEASKWTSIDAASMVHGIGANGKHNLYVGGYYGQLFYWNDDVKNDGVPSGTKEGSFTASAASESTITGSGFYTTGNGLKGRKVIITDEYNRPFAFATIASNTSTVLTFETAVVGFTIGQSYDYFIGGIDFRIYTRWYDAEQAFLRKRFDNVYVHVASDSDAGFMYFSTGFSYLGALSTTQRTVTLNVAGWDSAVWDSSVWGDSGTLKKRFNVWQSSSAIRVILLQTSVDKDIVLLKIGIKGRYLSDRYLT